MGRRDYLVRMVKKLTNLPVEVHTHNDFGMAVATELAGVEAGADCVHSCSNGLGERTGNAALEELAVALHVLYGYNTQYKLAKLPERDAIAARVWAAATTSGSRRSTSCSWRWTASSRTKASSSLPRPTGPTCSTRRC